MTSFTTTTLRFTTIKKIRYLNIAPDTEERIKNLGTTWPCHLIRIRFTVPVQAVIL